MVNIHDIPVAIDPWKLILPPEVHQRYVEILHPHTPKEVSKLVKRLKPEEKDEISERIDVIMGNVKIWQKAMQ